MKENFVSCTVVVFSTFTCYLGLFGPDGVTCQRQGSLETSSSPLSSVIAFTGVLVIIISLAVFTNSVYSTENDKYLFDSYSFTKKNANSVGEIDYIPFVIIHNIHASLQTRLRSLLSILYVHWILCPLRNGFFFWIWAGIGTYCHSLFSLAW